MMLCNLFLRAFGKWCLPRIKKNEIQLERTHEEYIVTKNFPDDVIEPLSSSELLQVKEIWGEQERGFKEIGLFKKYRGFDPRYMSHYFYLPLLARRLNNYHYTKFFEHKSLLGHIVKGDLKNPYCFIRCIDCEFYDNYMNQISRQEAIENCIKNDVIIVKDSVESSGGKSVEKVVLTEVKDRRKEIERIFNERKRDFVIQECIVQHPSISKYNESSINTFRITTLYLNGKFSVLSITLRFGAKGMKVDNWGAGGIIVGVQSNGKLNECGYDIKLNKYLQYNGITFKDEIIEQIPSLLKKIESAHKKCFSLCKFIGWDICFNQANEPVIIELNSSQPGVIGQQLCCGPIFGDRTQEVVDYCNMKEFKYNRAIFRY